MYTISYKFKLFSDQKKVERFNYSHILRIKDLLKNAYPTRHCIDSWSQNVRAAMEGNLITVGEISWLDQPHSRDDARSSRLRALPST